MASSRARNASIAERRRCRVGIGGAHGGGQKERPRPQGGEDPPPLSPLLLLPLLLLLLLLRQTIVRVTRVTVAEDAIDLRRAADLIFLARRLRRG